MPKPTQAHLERTVNKNDPLEVRQKTLSQMQYYMGAKLVEVRVNPQAVMYRWSIENRDDQQICTLSAFWGNSKQKILSGEKPLQGQELTNCARANASSGAEMAAMVCGFGSDIEHFKFTLEETVQKLELSPKSFSKLLS